MDGSRALVSYTFFLFMITADVRCSMLVGTYVLRGCVPRLLLCVEEWVGEVDVISVLRIELFLLDDEKKKCVIRFLIVLCLISSACNTLESL
jgi:hypothetical protein